MRLETRPWVAASVYKFARRHTRSLFTVPLTLHHFIARGERVSRGISLDISEAGVGALVQGSLQVGETVAIDLPLAERILNTVAIVRHTSKVSSGFEFVGLSSEERQQIVSITATGDARDN
jgi:hypothetical protein